MPGVIFYAIYLFRASPYGMAEVAQGRATRGGQEEALARLRPGAIVLLVAWSALRLVWGVAGVCVRSGWGFGGVGASWAPKIACVGARVRARVDVIAL